MDDNRPSVLPLAIAASVLFLLVAFVVVNHADGQTRPRFSLTLPRAPFISLDMDSLPESSRPTCWQEDTGYCDVFEDPYLIYTVTDWQWETQGGIWRSGDDCYIQMFYAQAEHPYLSDWLSECPYEVDEPTS